MMRRQKLNRMELTEKQKKEILCLITKFDLEFIQSMLKLLESERQEAKDEVLKELHDGIYNLKCKKESWDSYTAKEICLIIGKKMSGTK